jgi:succinoglycan biosynthesis transport protein ExoP
MVDHEPSLTLVRLSRIVARSWPFVVALGLLGALGAFVVSNAQAPIYKSTSSVYFSLRQAVTSSDLNQGSAYTESQMLSFATLATSSITLNRVIDDLNLNTSPRELAKTISTAIPQNTVILDVTASSGSASRSAQIANSVTSQLAEVVGELAPATKDAEPAVSARVIQPAVIPATQSSPNKTSDTALGGVLGLLIGLIGCVLFALGDTRLSSVEALARATSIPQLGAIARYRHHGDVLPAVLREPDGGEAESYRRMRSGVEFATDSPPLRTIVVTSSIAGEGKSTVAVNLALSLAESGIRVLLIDADLRSPRVGPWLGIDDPTGLSSALSSGLVSDVTRRYDSTSLHLLLAGTVPSSPSKLLSSSNLSAVIESLSRDYDKIVIDTPAVLDAPDAALIARHGDLTILVVGATGTHKPQVTRAIKSLAVAGVSVSRVVLNRANDPRARGAYGSNPSAGRGDVHSPPLVSPVADKADPPVADVKQQPVQSVVPEISATSGKGSTKPASGPTRAPRRPSAPRPRPSAQPGYEGDSGGK